MFAESFPNLGKAFHVTFTEPDVETFFRNVVQETVEFREKNNISRNDFMQLLIDIKNNKLTGEALNISEYF